MDNRDEDCNPTIRDRIGDEKLAELLKRVRADQADADARGVA